MSICLTVNVPYGSLWLFADPCHPLGHLVLLRCGAILLITELAPLLREEKEESITHKTHNAAHNS